MTLKIVIAVLTLLIGLGNLIDSIKNWNTLPLYSKLLTPSTGILLLFVCIDTVYDLWKEKKEEKIEATTGELMDLLTDRPRLGVIGRIDYIFLGNEKKEIIMVDPYGDTHMFKAAVIDGKLKLNFLIYGEDRRLVAGIQENFWTVYNTDYEYNNDERAFEIVTPVERKVLFQLLIVDDGVRIGGLLRNYTGGGLYFFNNHTGPSMRPANTSEGWALPHDKVKKLFKYPRKKYLGVRDE